MSAFDVLIKNALIVDGSGKAPYKGSIGLKGDKVVALGEVKGDAVKVVDASGLVASPGFIDAHSHGDGTILFYPKCQNYVMQGVTTFIGGQCGGSPAPVGEMSGLPGLARDYIQELEPHKYYPEKTVFPLEDVNALMEDKFGWSITWKTMADGAGGDEGAHPGGDGRRLHRHEHRVGLRPRRMGPHG